MIHTYLNIDPVAAANLGAVFLALSVGIITLLGIIWYYTRGTGR